LNSVIVSNERGRRAELKRFGYRAGVDDSDYLTIWRQLRGDFPARWAGVEFPALTGEARAVVQRYCAHRASLDALMDRCDEIHLEIFHYGPGRDRVETYADARDAYEDAVDEFGELRAAVQAALAASADT
jgi:hypothetical protein